ncbi:MAG: TetR/AcrR family transcriptional regulator [Bacteroidota bacterium]
MSVTTTPKQEIIDTALTEFLNKGIKSFTVKDLTELMGISTKTVYKVVGDKTNLLRTCLQQHYSMLHTELSDLASTKKNALEIVLAMMDVIVKKEFEVNPHFYRDLNRYYPNLQDEILDNHMEIQTLCVALIRQGIQEGLIRPDINENLAWLSLRRLYSGITRDGIYTAYDFPITDLIRNTIIIFFRGMCTSKGIQMVQKFDMISQSSLSNGN